MTHTLQRALTIGLAAVVLASACSGSDDAASSDGARLTTEASTADEPPATDVVVATAPPSDDGSASTDAAASAPSTGEAPATASENEDDQADAGPEESTTTVPASTVTEDDLAVFLAAVEQAIEGTSLEGTVLDDPDIYISLAQSACTRFTEGDDFDTVASDVLESLGAGDDDAILVGALLGAATGTICPEHADQI